MYFFLLTLLMITGTVSNQSERFDCTRSAAHSPQTNQRQLQNAQCCFVNMDTYSGNSLEDVDLRRCGSAAGVCARSGRRELDLH